MIRFLSDEKMSMRGETFMEVCSYIDDWCLFTIIDETHTVSREDGQGETLTYVLGGNAGGVGIPYLYEFSQGGKHGRLSFPDGSFIQNHESETAMRQWMEVAVNGEQTTFIIGEFPSIGKREYGYCYSYTMTTERFQRMASEMMELHNSVNN